MGRSRRFGNDTLDVLNKGCLDAFDSLACGRISILIFISTITFLFILLKIIKYHSFKHSQLHHYVIFYVSAVECIVCGASFILGIRYPQLDFTRSFFKLFQFILICHLQWSMAARSRHRDDIIQHVVNPVLCLYTLYCTTVVLMGMVDISSTWVECFRPYWLMLSSADFISVQLFAIVALYLSHSSKHSTISVLMLPSSTSQTRDLWLITAVYEISAVVSVVFDAIMSFMGRDHTGCSGIYSHVQFYYSSTMIVVMLLKFYLPTWTLLCIFQPTRVKSRPSEVALTSHYNTDGTCYNRYHRMFLPQNDYLQSSVPYPIIPCTPDSPIYEGFGDFSYTDSSPDTSPTITRYWVGMDESAYNGSDKQMTNSNRKKDILENQRRMEQARESLERSLGIDLDNESSMEVSQNNRNLTTIKEENTSIIENSHE
ncbi:uncharacterized protein [Prorops nasuta]|uniref:uncharacterized protein n=1 Tax=Prorops nasuta TaxID=863751 RepID=UPI0034CF2FC6